MRIGRMRICSEVCILSPLQRASQVTTCPSAVWPHTCCMRSSKYTTQEFHHGGTHQIQLLGTRCVQASSNLYKRTSQLRYVQASCAASCSENYKTNIMHRLLGKNGVE